MTKIDSADMSGELAPEYIKTAVFNMVKIITILSVADWVEVFKEFTEWVTHNDEYQQEPAAYAGLLRLYFCTEERPRFASTYQRQSQVPINSQEATASLAQLETTK